MSTNFRTFYETVGSPKEMNVRDLVEGQHLIRIIRPRNDSLEEVRTVEYTIVKVLKTRLVLEDCATGKELRLLVEQPSWMPEYMRGNVTTRREGSSQSFGYAPYEFATEDETELIGKIIAHRAEQNDKRRAKNDAYAAVSQIKNQLNPNLESVENAIQALQVLADVLRG